MRRKTGFLVFQDRAFFSQVAENAKGDRARGKWVPSDLARLKTVSLESSSVLIAMGPVVECPLWQVLVAVPHVAHRGLLQRFAGLEASRRSR